VLVTGASRGIGAAAARAFAAAGDRVAVHYASRREQAEEVAASLPGEGHAVVGADLADAGAVAAMVDAAAGALGGIDVLVNNAGIYEAHPIAETTYEEWRRSWARTLDVNLVGPANVTWCAVRHMLAGGRGRIVNVGSRGAFRGEPEHTAYGAAKAGLTSFGQSLARELGPHGIAVMTVAPGFVATDMAARLPRRAGGRRDPRAEPAGPGRHRGGGRRRDRLPRVAGGADGHGHRARRQRRLVPADVTARA
jgi:NAD(P)-dependent dehydrogenase (short-subunit alcohol dehydrogenase family)